MVFKDQDAPEHVQVWWGGVVKSEETYIGIARVQGSRWEWRGEEVRGVEGRRRVVKSEKTYIGVAKFAVTPGMVFKDQDAPKHVQSYNLSLCPLKKPACLMLSTRVCLTAHSMANSAQVAQYLISFSSPIAKQLFSKTAP